METRIYQVSDQAAFVALSQCVNTHFASVTEPCRARGVGVTVSLPSPESGAVLDSIIGAVARSNPHLCITQIRRGTAYLNVEKESAWGTGVRPEHSLKADLRIILESLGKPADPGPPPVSSATMTDQIALIWPNLEPLEQRITLAELMKNTPMTRAEIQAQITGLIERLVAEAVKERAQS